MSQQFLLALEPEKFENQYQFRWCWLDEGRALHEGQGPLARLADSVQSLHQQAWLLLPGNQVLVRELEFSEKERKHLRSLLPYQLEDSVIGDIDDLHFALGQPEKGKVNLAYTDKSVLRDLFEQCADCGIEISRCLALPQLIRKSSAHISPSLESSSEEQSTETFEQTQQWFLALHQGLVNVVLPDLPSFCVPLQHLSFALNAAIKEQGLSQTLPWIFLRAEEAEDLSQLEQALPENLKLRVREKEIASLWHLDFSAQAINLCQGDFSQRLPLDRWWKQWKNIAVFALFTLIVYLTSAGVSLYKANKQNLYLRQQIEAQFRQIVPTGDVRDPESSLRARWERLQPKAAGSSAMSLLAGVLPVVASNPDVNLKVMSFASETGELTLSIQAHNFAAIDGLRQSLADQGFNAEILTANAQGDTNSARIKVSKP